MALPEVVGYDMRRILSALKAHNALLAFLAVVLLSRPLCAQERVLVDSLFAPSLGMERTFIVLQPVVRDTAERFPVLFLLHGYSGGYRDWIDRTKLREYVRDLPLIVVLPDADNSWYVNSATNSSLRYEDYIVHDLRETIAARYPVDTTREAIAGLSMGGSGALMLAMKHPTLFRFAGSFSGAFPLLRFMDDSVTQPVSRGIAASLRAAYGAVPGPVRTENDVFTLVQHADSTWPYLYMATGIQDGFRTFLAQHRLLTDSLRAHGVSYEYHETVGGHSWQYWDRELKRMLPRLREILKF